MSILEELKVKEILGLVHIYYGDGRDSDGKVIAVWCSDEDVPVVNPDGTELAVDRDGLNIKLSNSLILDRDFTRIRDCTFTFIKDVEYGLILKGSCIVVKGCNFNAAKGVTVSGMIRLESGAENCSVSDCNFNYC